MLYLPCFKPVGLPSNLIHCITVKTSEQMLAYPTVILPCFIEATLRQMNTK